MTNRRDMDLVERVVDNTGYDVATVKKYLRDVKKMTTTSNITAENMAALVRIRNDEEVELFSCRIKQKINHPINFETFMQLLPDDLGTRILGDDWETALNEL